MPRGRHRHSPPLHRLLPPSAIAGVPLVCAAGAWLTAEPFVLRGLAGVAACVAVVGAIVMRRWDRLAGKRVAELNRSRASDEWRHDERIAELESDLDESRELRGKLEARLRAKRTELAALRNEHAALLRRYATAETERASALEGRRQLAIEASAPARALPAAAEPAPGAELVPAQRATSADAPATPPDTSPATPPQASPASATATPLATSPVLYLRANAALDRLARGAHPRGGDAGQGQARQETGPQDVRNERNERKEQGETPQGKSEAARAQELQHAAARPSGVPGHFTVPAAAAVVPPAAVRRSPVEGGFDFFGTKAVAPAALEAVQNQDLADVVGEEAMALHKADAEAEFKQADAEGEAVSQVIDLTAHDETEQIDVAELRSALGA
ncbi:hypothetical protein EOT10_35875 [Streptomyces antnestii]|uniref:Secreted protein n=1 Tax=Streptomyces antnestii TaxID=2494256 RepID=A0A437P3B9_9ACTN|nr:hypothetical protein [Streptomyces sp. San01]RVU16745.1 hypothetical protein EOT10_35875 [Streptomyces sp. San01]